MSDDIPLLRIPTISRTTADLLGLAGHLDLPNAVLLSEREDGSLVFLTTDMSLAQANWMIDRMKMILLGPNPEYAGG